MGRNFEENSEINEKVRNVIGLFAICAIMVWWEGSWDRCQSGTQSCC